MSRKALAGISGVGLAAAIFAALAGAQANSAAQAVPSAQAGKIPPAMLALYQGAAQTCPGLSWTVLAGIGTVETANGTAANQVSPAGAEGPMQFMPATWAAYGVVAPVPGAAAPPNIWNAPDAVYSTANMLCADGAGNPATLTAAIYSYNHSSAYVAQVLADARSYAAAPATSASLVSSAGVSGAATLAVEAAKSQLGLAYVWGAESPGVAFDCSGLTQWAMAQAGVTVPRTAQLQYNAGPQIPISALQPGDLVFFGAGPTAISHVGIYVGGGQMIDAPNASSVIRYDTIQGFTPPLVGATAPAG